MTLRQMRKYCEDHQWRLKLAHWEIKIRLATKEEEELPANKERNGYVWWNDEHTLAEIVVLKHCENVKRLIIHELHHIRIEGHKPQPARKSIPIEIAINALTEAYLA